MYGAQNAAKLAAAYAVPIDPRLVAPAPQKQAGSEKLGNEARIADADKLEAELLQQITVLKLPVPAREYRFDEVRKYRFDFAWPLVKVAAECEGGVWTQGRHTRGQGYIDDCIKYNLATSLGWRVYRFPENLIADGTAIATLEVALGNAFPTEDQHIDNNITRSS